MILLEIIHKSTEINWPNPVNEDPEYLAEWLAFELGDRSNIILYRQAAWFVLKETLRVIVAKTQEEFNQLENAKKPSMIFKNKLDIVVGGDWDKFVENRIRMQ